MHCSKCVSLWGTSYFRPPIDRYFTSPLLQNPGDVTDCITMTVSGSGISSASCKSAPRSRQITTPVPHHSVFTGRMPFLLPSQQRQSTEGQKILTRNKIKTTTTNQPFNGRLSGTTRVGRYQKKHSPILVNVLPLSPSSICNGPRHPLYSAYVLDSPLGQPLSRE